MKIIEKAKAIELRKEGKTFFEILQEIPVSKSSLSYWLRDIELTDSQKSRIYGKNLNIRRKFIDYNKQKQQKIMREKENILKNSQQEIRNLSKQELKLVGIALYWAEGYKANTAKSVEFTNSDPAMISLIMKWFREICNISEDKFRVRIQIHNPSDIDEAVKFWSTRTGLLSKQFTKPYIKISPTSKGKATNSLPYGICHIRISDTNLLTKIKGWVNGLSGLIV